MRATKHLFIIVTALASTMSSPGQETLSVRFDGPPAQPTNSQYGVTAYSESGMLFLPGPNDFDGQFARNGGGSAVYPNNGSAYMQTAYGESVEFDFSNDSLFGIYSVDLAAYSIYIPNYTVEFVGYRPDGSAITASFSGTGADFQTYDFGPDWSSGLTEVQIPNAPWSLDNLVVTIPEPSITSLLALGAVVFTCYEVRRRKKI